MSQHDVWLHNYRSHYFDYPPASLPEVLPAPQQAFSLAQPFSIDPKLYNAVLDAKVPITIASLYAVTVTILNAVNRQRKHQPWAISKTRVFFALVIVHNIFLAIYSAWTFVGMTNAIRNTWPGWQGSDSLPAIVDAFCKIQGPRGLGDAVSYNPETSAWFTGNPLIKLLNNNPDPSDVGRLWNGGLAFYGWFFYLSKFYEVVDTLIILAKGKRSSFLQTYHHAGAMLCMWAGIRYMSPPIWMFCWLNSGIHALMYTYYTLSALGVRVPNRLKKSLTTMQITQFVVGFGFAIVHLFISYKVPVQSPYIHYHEHSTALPSATAAVASAVPTADIGSWLKKAILRAAGDEGLSANVRNRNGNLFGHSGEQAALAESEVLGKAKSEVRYKLEYVSADCIDTSGQAFAILLNALYLLPLTFLFARFFIKSYLRRPVSKNESQARRFSKSAYDAAKGTEHEIVKAMRRDRGSALTSPVHSDAEVSTPTSASFKNKNLPSMTKISEKANDVYTKSANGVKNAAKKAQNSDLAAQAKDTPNKALESAKEAAANLSKKAESNAQEVESELKQASQDKIGDAKQTTKKVGNDVKHATNDKVEEVKKEADETSDTTKSPSKKKKKNKNKNKDGNSAAQSGPSSYAEAAAQPPISDANDIVKSADATLVADSSTASDPQALEASIDEIKNEEEEKAEAEMQPEGLSQS